jgi:hypothetical protein
MTTLDHGVHATARRLSESLRSYIEAQYHIRDESLIRERRRMLEETGAVNQVPFVESTPVYELGRPYDSLNIPEPAKGALTELARIGTGLYSFPYVHQAAALEAFFHGGRDLIVATGTRLGEDRKLPHAHYRPTRNGGQRAFSDGDASGDARASALSDERARQ